MPKPNAFVAVVMLILIINVFVAASDMEKYWVQFILSIVIVNILYYCFFIEVTNGQGSSQG